MSAGAVFKLIANDGKADRMILATKLLNQRIKEVMCARKRAGKADITPTLVDLERTHILFVNAHFKPFAAIGFEYNKVRPQSGTAQFGGGIVFSIPQFGDFFHDMVCRVRLTQVSGVASTLGTLLTASTTLPANSNVVDAFGNLIATTGNAAQGTGIVTAALEDGYNLTDNYSNLVRYCEYPGNALFDLVKFEVNGNPLDQYDEIVPTMLEKFTVAPNKRVGHDKLVGQQTALEGYGPLTATRVTDQNVAGTPAAVINKNTQGQSNQTVGLFAGDVANNPDGPFTTAGIAFDTAVIPLNNDAGVQNQFDVNRIGINVYNGPQIPKPVQPALEIWNKLRFWFCDDVRLSIASVSIPFGQRFIHIELAQLNQLVFEYPAVWAIATPAVADTIHEPIFQTLGIVAPTIQLVELYINNIFVNPEIHDIYIKRIGFSLIRVYRQQRQVVNASGSDEKLLSQLKWPIEYMWVGLRPTFNVAVPSTSGVVASFAGITNNPDMWHDWHRMTRQVNARSFTGLNVTNSTLGQLPTPTEYWLPVSTVDTLGLTAHGITIYDNFADTFYNAYMPFHYGGAALVTPSDPGALFVNMSLYPRGYQPSGHLNISRARETYLQWNSTYISSTSTAELLVVAVAINFLLITDGSAVLRYST